MSSPSENVRNCAKKTQKNPENYFGMKITNLHSF